MRRLIAVLVLIGVAAASAADDYLTEILDAPTPAARQPLLQAHREKLSYGTVMGLARAAEAAATSERGARAMEVADEIAALLAEDRAIAYAAMLRGHFHLTREELPPAAKAFEKAATHWQQADWPSAAASAQAWRAVCAARLGQTEQAKVWLERSLSDAPRLGPVVRPAADQEAVLHAWAATRRAGFEEDSQRWVAAETWYLEAVRRWEPTGLALPLAHALDRAGLVSYYQSKLDQATALYRRSLAAAEQATDAHQIGRAHLGFAEIANDRADHETVLRELEAAVEPFRQAGSNVDLARVYWLRAVVRQNRGEHHLVEAELQQAEAAYRAADSPGGLADCGFVRGSNWLYLGDRARALDAWAEAARIYDEVNNRLGAANVKLKQSHAYRLVGMYDEARRLSEEALGSYRLLRDRPGEANCLRALGLVAKATGDLQAAEERYEQAAAIYQAIGDQLGQAYVDYLRGTIMRERGEAAEPAIKLLLDSMNRYEAIGDRHGAALPAIELGVICAVHGDGELAYRAFMKALSLGEQTGSRSIMASALYRLGQLAEARQPPDLAAAAELYQMAVDVVEQMRARAGSQEAQQGLQQGYLDYYDALVRVLVRRQQPALALAAAEAARARTLLDLVAGAGIDLSAGMSVASRGREEALAWRVTELNVTLGRRLADEATPEPELEQLRSDLRAARGELSRFQADLYSTHPELGRRRGAQPLATADIAAGLPAGTALVEYYLTSAANGGRPQPSYALVLQGGGEPRVAAVELALTAADAASLTEGFRAACANPRRRYTAKGQEAFAAVLEPVLKLLGADIKRLVIVPDGPLFELPFQALPLAGAELLWDRYAISYALSGTLLRHAQERPASGQGLLLFANPSFGKLIRSPDLQRGAALEALPGTAQEAAALGGRFGPRAESYQGAAALEETAKARMAGFQYIHFATHGLLDSASPMSSAVVLAEPPAASREDGQLEARELMLLKLNAELVSLSACETGRGRVQPGEGLRGLSWALTAAGARSLLVSLWKVSDDATRDLMDGFYQRLLSGLDKDEALRQTAQAMRAEAGREHPYYWAPFVLMGTW